MALIACPECGREVSSEAVACPKCGYPVARRLAEKSPVPPALTPAVESQEILREVRPSWWNFGWHLLFCWLVVPFVVALVKRNGYRMRIYADRVSIIEGLWAKETTEFFIKDIRAIDLRQGLWGRLVGIGDVTISTAASVDADETAEGVPQPAVIKDLLISLRQSGNLAANQ